MFALIFDCHPCFPIPNCFMSSVFEEAYLYLLRWLFFAMAFFLWLFHLILLEVFPGHFWNRKLFELVYFPYIAAWL